MAPASYVPGQLQFSGSPLLEVLTIKYCRLVRALIAHCRSCAVARLGLSRYQAGRPVASERRAMVLPPKRPARRPSRRVILVIGGSPFKGRSRPRLVTRKRG